MKLIKLLARSIFILNSFINIFIQNMQEFVLLEPLKLVCSFNNNKCLSEVLV